MRELLRKNDSQKTNNGQWDTERVSVSLSLPCVTHVCIPLSSLFRIKEITDWSYWNLAPFLHNCADFPHTPSDWKTLMYLTNLLAKFERKNISALPKIVQVLLEKLKWQQKQLLRLYNISSEQFILVVENSKNTALVICHYQYRWKYC